jgi:hypothetical protein
MENKSVFIKILAVVGTVLVWFPILTPVLLSAAALIQDRIFRFDFLMPAELFLFAAAGSVLLMCAAVRARAHGRLIRWGIALAAVMIVGGGVIAQVTGLATGETEPGGWQSALVLVTLAAYSLALVVIGVGGILLLRDLFKPPRSPAQSL